MIERRIPLLSPEELKERLPLPRKTAEIKKTRDKLCETVLTGGSDKLLVIVGPCSAHDKNAVLRYVTRLGELSEKVKEKLTIVSRIYTSKPRTRGVGYTGMIFCPRFGSGEGEKENAAEGLFCARELHLQAIACSGLTAADEMLCPENYEYLSDVLGYHAVGARSSEDAQHRAVASGLDAPVGIKNPMSGSIPALVNSVYAAQRPQAFFCRGEERFTSGNPLAHAILRGRVDEEGRDLPNYGYPSLMRVLAEIERNGKIQNPSLIVDANHSNSGKRFSEQGRIVKEVMESRKREGALGKLIKGFMIESFLAEGNQSENEVFGKSVTDPCLSWKDTERLLFELADLA